MIGWDIAGEDIVKSVDSEERKVRAYCYDLLAQVADLLASRGGEPETAEIVRALIKPPFRAARVASGDGQRFAPEPASFVST